MFKNLFDHILKIKNSNGVVTYEKDKVLRILNFLSTRVVNGYVVSKDNDGFLTGYKLLNGKFVQRHFLTCDKSVIDTDSKVTNIDELEEIKVEMNNIYLNFNIITEDPFRNIIKLFTAEYAAKRRECIKVDDSNPVKSLKFYKNISLERNYNRLNNIMAEIEVIKAMKDFIRHFSTKQIDEFLNKDLNDCIKKLETLETKLKETVSNKQRKTTDQVFAETNQDYMLQVTGAVLENGEVVATDTETIVVTGESHLSYVGRRLNELAGEETNVSPIVQLYMKRLANKKDIVKAINEQNKITIVSGGIKKVFKRIPTTNSWVKEFRYAFVPEDQFEVYQAIVANYCPQANYTIKQANDNRNKQLVANTTKQVTAVGTGLCSKGMQGKFDLTKVIVIKSPKTLVKATKALMAKVVNGKFDLIKFQKDMDTWTVTNQNFDGIAFTGSKCVAINLETKEEIHLSNCLMRILNDGSFIKAKGNCSGIVDFLAAFNAQLFDEYTKQWITITDQSMIVALDNVKGLKEKSPVVIPSIKVDNLTILKEKNGEIYFEEKQVDMTIDFVKQTIVKETKEELLSNITIKEEVPHPTEEEFFKNMEEGRDLKATALSMLKGQLDENELKKDQESTINTVEEYCGCVGDDVPEDEIAALITSVAKNDIEKQEAIHKPGQLNKQRLALIEESVKTALQSLTCAKTRIKWAEYTSIGFEDIRTFLNIIDKDSREAIVKYFKDKYDVDLLKEDLVGLKEFYHPVMSKILIELNIELRLKDPNAKLYSAYCGVCRYPLNNNWQMIKAYCLGSAREDATLDELLKIKNKIDALAEIYSTLDEPLFNSASEVFICISNGDRDDHIFIFWCFNAEIEIYGKKTKGCYLAGMPFTYYIERELADEKIPYVIDLELTGKETILSRDNMLKSQNTPDELTGKASNNQYVNVCFAQSFARLFKSLKKNINKVNYQGLTVKEFLEVESQYVRQGEVPSITDALLSNKDFYLRYKNCVRQTPAFENNEGKILVSNSKRLTKVQETLSKCFLLTGERYVEDNIMNCKDLKDIIDTIEALNKEFMDFVTAKGGSYINVVVDLSKHGGENATINLPFTTKTKISFDTEFGKQYFFEYNPNFELVEEYLNVKVFKDKRTNKLYHQVECFAMLVQKVKYELAEEKGLLNNPLISAIFNGDVEINKPVLTSECRNMLMKFMGIDISHTYPNGEIQFFHKGEPVQSMADFYLDPQYMDEADLAKVPSYVNILLKNKELLDYYKRMGLATRMVETNLGDENKATNNGKSTFNLNRRKAARKLETALVNNEHLNNEIVLLFALYIVERIFGVVFDCISTRVNSKKEPKTTKEFVAKVSEIKKYLDEHPSEMITFLTKDNKDFSYLIEKGFNFKIPYDIVSFCLKNFYNLSREEIRYYQESEEKTGIFLEEAFSSKGDFKRITPYGMLMSLIKSEYRNATAKRIKFVNVADDANKIVIQNSKATVYTKTNSATTCNTAGLFFTSVTELEVVNGIIHYQGKDVNIGFALNGVYEFENNLVYLNNTYELDSISNIPDGEYIIKETIDNKKFISYYKQLDEISLKKDIENASKACFKEFAKPDKEGRRPKKFNNIICFNMLPMYRDMVIAARKDTNDNVVWFCKGKRILFDTVDSVELEYVKDNKYAIKEHKIEIDNELLNPFGKGQMTLVFNAEDIPEYLKILMKVYLKKQKINDFKLNTEDYAKASIIKVQNNGVEVNSTNEELSRCKLTLDNISKCSAVLKGTRRELIKFDLSVIGRMK